MQEEPFASMKPLHCSNQSGVYRWLESMITHHPADAEQTAQSRGECMAAYLVDSCSLADKYAIP